VGAELAVVMTDTYDIRDTDHLAVVARVARSEDAR
jgi:hypothetical protein